LERLVTAEEDLHFATLMAAAQDGDGAAYTQLLTRAAALLKRYTSSRVDGTAWVDEVVQETLISVHQSRHTFDPSRSFASWMFAIASHRLADHFRRLKRRSEFEEAIEGDWPELPAEDPFVGDDRQAAVELIERLSGRQREVLTLLKLEGLSIREAASRLGMSEGAVKAMAHRAYKALRERRSTENEND